MELRPSNRTAPDSSARPPPDGTFVLGGHRFVLYRQPAGEPTEDLERMLRRGHPEDDIATVTLEGRSYFVLEERPDPPAGPVTAVLDCLTERELQIVALVASGKGNKEVADRLHISEWTVSTHLRRVFAKLGVTNRAAMVFQCAQVLDTIRAAASSRLGVAGRWRSRDGPGR